MIGTVFSDDGSYFEGATNYVRLAAEILLHCANACENYGLNLKDVLAELRTAGYDGTATIELVTNYIDAPSAAAKMALERAKELLC